MAKKLTKDINKPIKSTIYIKWNNVMLTVYFDILFIIWYDAVTNTNIMNIKNIQLYPTIMD